MAEGSKLVIEDLHVSVEGNEIIKGLSLEVKTGEVHAIMGPNGSGKSTLAYTLMGHPRYDVTEGSVTLDGEDLLDMEPDERARAGLFLAFQYPTEIEGVTVANFLRTAINARRGPGNEISVSEFAKKLREKMELLDMDPSFAQRYLNDGFSGGEKKRNEILQMAMLEPTFAIMDETDSGLDIDALQIVSNGVNQLKGPTWASSSLRTISASSGTWSPTSCMFWSTAASSVRAVRNSPRSSRRRVTTGSGKRSNPVGCKGGYVDER